MVGNKAAKARTAVDLAVPLSPWIKTPPILGLMAFKINARTISSCPTMAVNGYINRSVLRLIVIIYIVHDFDPHFYN